MQPNHEPAGVPALPAANDLRGALAELVALQDLTQQMARLAADPGFLASDEKLAQHDRMSTEYSNRRQAAWSAARAALQLSAPVVPPGYALVPGKATRAMQDAWDGAPSSEDSDAEFQGAYAAMLAAAPTPPAALDLQASVNIHSVKLKTRKEMEATIPRERLGWWHDVCPGQQMMLRDATEADLARCMLRNKDSAKPEDYLCELPADGSLVSKAALKHCRTIRVPAAPALDQQAVRDAALEEAAAAARLVSDRYGYGYSGHEVDAVDEAIAAIRALKSTNGGDAK
ncbi:hypothetical protein RAN3_2491 [plant metagenome]|uniref:Uncharacterized protein n=1 Tax=plant metagenome TaxID=1297885 RepID=A0A484U4P8_9ZZZZ